MKKWFSLFALCFTMVVGLKADVFVSEHLSVTKGAQVKSTVKADTYYIISGDDQNNVEHYLYDNGKQVKGSATFVAKGEQTAAHIWTLEASGDQWLIKNYATGQYMNLGGSNGSAITTSATQQTNAIHFGNGYFTILNNNGQAIDMTANGANPTTWKGTTSPDGSRRLKIYEATNLSTVQHKSLSLLPAPKYAVVGEGEYVLPTQFTVSVGDFADTDVKYEVLADAARFITTLQRATGTQVDVLDAGEANLVITENKNLAAEGYVLDINTEGIAIEAATSDGAYYALQTILCLLPPHVVLGQSSDTPQTYALPVARIEDEPRFAYRGFMLDVSRHFFTIEQVKKMLDLMAIYKMNVFHWHLTDDQGWRAEIKQYPLLTTKGAERRSSYDTPITRIEENGQVYWTGEGAQTNRPYGPFYYTQEEMKEVVNYAAERHIDVLPEVDMPGHFVAALAAYPQYSCHPNYAPEVWITGGVSADVLNVANPEAVQFAKNIITELCEIFPYPYFHIGGDECPTSQWQSNELCKEKLQQLGKTNFRALQTEFIREINEHLASLGKKMFCWNESITENGADLELMKQSGATIMCWNPCQGGAAKAASLGLDAIITEWGSGCYYINRRQSNDYGEPTAAGYGNDNVAATYNYMPVPTNVSADAAKHYIGVQATFWTEHVCSNEYLEYLALPRLMCIAEAGWSQQEAKNWQSFVRRMTLDTRMLDLGEYIYARHWMDNYVPRQAPASVIADGSVVTFTNKSADRGQGLTDNEGALNGQGATSTQWVLEATNQEGLFYIRSAVSGKYLYAANGNSGTAVELSELKTPWAFDTSTVPGYVAICYKSVSGLAVNNNVNNTTHLRLFAHGTGNGASFWAIGSENDDTLKEGEHGKLIYNYYYRGLSVGKQEFTLEAGTTYPPHVDHTPKGFVVTSKKALSGTVTLKRQTIEIAVDRVPEQGRFYSFFNPTLNKFLSTDEATAETFSAETKTAHTLFYYNNDALMAFERGQFLNGAALAEVGAQGSSIFIAPSETGEADMYNIISQSVDYLRLYNNAATANTVGTKAQAAKAKTYDFNARYALTLPVTFDAHGWATCSAPVALTIPQGVVAYVAESYQSALANVQLKAFMPGTTIAANTGVLLKGEPETVCHLSISEDGYVPAANLLQSAVTAQYLPETANAYTILAERNQVSFKRMSASSLQQAHSAWLSLPTQAPETVMATLPQVETGVETILVPSQPRGIYNLHGQKLQKPQRGVNIVNGKKVIVK
ncbi:MAG: family 20 glycosylhydrolase [Bacteroidaceae bacterium]|nr:family 20 glycosylhydrolase [Bacteroidaceae bacterium]